jgi:hypothetical protein
MVIIELNGPWLPVCICCLGVEGVRSLRHLLMQLLHLCHGSCHGKVVSAAGVKFEFTSEMYQNVGT